jgi:hypothetical protein
MVDLDAIEVFGAAAPTCYALTLGHTGQGSNPVASPTNSSGCPAGQYLAGASIALSGAAPASGWQISGWTGTTNNASTASTNTVTMPASAHTANVNYSTTYGPGKYDGTHSGWTFTGGWSHYTTSGPYNNTLTYSSTVGNEATFVITGSQFKLTYGQYTNRGVVDIYVDGVLVHSLNENGALQWQKTWTSNDLGAGTHTLRFVHASGTMVDLDAIEVFGAAAPTCYALTLGHTGQGSNPVASPTNSSGCPAGQYLAGASIALSGAAPASGWQISGWTGTTNNASTASTNTVTMPASAHTANVNYSTTYGPGKYDGTHSGWTYTGSWSLYSTSGPYNNTLNYSSTVGNEATFVMTGSQFVLTYNQYTNRGVVDIYVDGVLIHSLNENGALQWQKTWTSNDLGAGTHTLRFVHASGTMVDLDAVEILP